MTTLNKFLLHSRLIIILVVGLFPFNDLFAQSNNPILKFIYNRGINNLTSVIIVNDENLDHQDSINVDRFYANQDLLYGNKNAYVLVKGTGKVFKIDSNFKISKIDKTIYAGSSFGATNFIYNDTLFSIGGYGFWNINGAVRFFNFNTREWDVIRVNKNIPFANGINSNSYLDKRNGKLYLIYNESNPEYVEAKYLEENNCYLSILDLKSKKWMETKFLINPKIAKSFSDLGLIQVIDDKILASSKYLNNPLLIDIANNNIQEIKDTKYTEWIQLKSHINKGAIINIKDTVFLFNYDTTYKFFINQKDLKKLTIKLYEPIQQNVSSEYLIIIILSILIILLFIVLLIFIKNIRTQKNKIEAEATNSIGTDKRSIQDYYLNLSEIEKQTLELIVKNSWNGLTTSVNQINKILGTERKPGKIQNNIRGDIIMELNNKFKLYTLLNDNLIDRKKSEFDKRHIEYFISENLISKFPKKLFD
jgi:hypothetical protein